MVKNPLPSAEDIRDGGLIPGSGRSPGRGDGNPWSEEPGGLWYIGSQRVRHSFSDLARMHAQFIHPSSVSYFSNS